MTASIAAERAQQKQDRADFRRSVRAFLAAHGATSHAPTFDTVRDPGPIVSAWRRACAELGVAALWVPEAHGGLEAHPDFPVIALEEAGRVVSPLPLSSVAFAVAVLNEIGEGTAQTDLLSRVAVGDAIAVAALQERPHDWSGSHVATRAIENDGSWRVSGTKEAILDLDLADVLLVSATTPDGTVLLAVEADAVGVHRELEPALDPTRAVGRARLDDAPAVLLGRAEQGRMAAALRAGAFALAAEQLGVAAGALEMAVEYAGGRVQFGRPVGSFQAIKHLLADRYVEVECLRAAVEQTAVALDLGDDDAAVLAHLCQAMGSEVAIAAAGASIQVHGGLGFTWEHRAHLYFKRATVGRQWLGTPDHHREHIARLTLDENEE